MSNRLPNCLYLNQTEYLKNTFVKRLLCVDVAKFTLDNIFRQI